MCSTVGGGGGGGGGFSTVRGIMMHVRDILSTVGNIMSAVEGLS